MSEVPGTCPECGAAEAGRSLVQPVGQTDEILMPRYLCGSLIDLKHRMFDLRSVVCLRNTYDDGIRHTTSPRPDAQGFWSNGYVVVYVGGDEGKRLAVTGCVISDEDKFFEEWGGPWALLDLLGYARAAQRSTARGGKA